jgi:hypothetical protein
LFSKYLLSYCDNRKYPYNRPKYSTVLKTLKILRTSRKYQTSKSTSNIYDNKSSHFLAGSDRHPFKETSSSDSEEEVLRRLKLQQSKSIQSGQKTKYGGLYSPLEQSIHLDGFQPVLVDTSATSSAKANKYSSSNAISIYNKGHRFISGNNNNRDLLGQAERGKIGSTSSECSSNSSVEASVDRNFGHLHNEKKGTSDITAYLTAVTIVLFRHFRTQTN